MLTGARNCGNKIVVNEADVLLLSIYEYILYVEKLDGLGLMFPVLSSVGNAII